MENAGYQLLGIVPGRRIPGDMNRRHHRDILLAAVARMADRVFEIDDPSPFGKSGAHERELPAFGNPAHAEYFLGLKPVMVEIGHHPGDRCPARPRGEDEEGPARLCELACERQQRAFLRQLAERFERSLENEMTKIGRVVDFGSDAVPPGFPFQKPALARPFRQLVGKIFDWRGEHAVEVEDRGRRLRAELVVEPAQARLRGRCVERVHTGMIREHGSTLAAGGAFGYCVRMTLNAPDAEITLTATQLAGVALSTVRAVIGDVKYQYLSGPITGGQTFIGWHCSTGRNIPELEYKAAREMAVLRPNITAVQAAAKAERDAKRNTIEPGSFEADFQHWGQKEFLDFWEAVIEQHAASVRFMDGWEYSSGCTFEYHCARRYGLETCDMLGEALGPDRALPMLDAALADIGTKFDAGDSRDAPLARLHDGIRGYREKIVSLA